MSIKSDLIGNSQDSFKTHAQRGGRLSTTFSTLNAQANAGMGKYPLLVYIMMVVINNLVVVMDSINNLSLIMPLLKAVILAFQIY